ncbi:hypothetical protein BDQ12DRAFT_609640, partial [Crucibulum laeve]
PFLDSDGHVIACLVGQPCNPSYTKSCHHAYKEIMEGCQSTASTEDEQTHHRGNYPAVHIGVTMPPGGSHPTNLCSGSHGPMVERLLQNGHIKHIASFAEAAFSLWVEGLYEHYKQHSNALLAHHQHLHRIFSKSVFSAVMFNFGPQVWTRKHCDSQNLAFGWCAIQVLGIFDHTKGGHLVLPDLRLVAEFPSGSLILLPSAMLTHANVPVGDGESRASFTQYSSGGLFHYVDNGFQTDTCLQKEDPDEFKHICTLKASYWSLGLKLFSKLSNVVEPV